MYETVVFTPTDSCEKKYNTVLTKQRHGRKVVIYTVETFLITLRLYWREEKRCHADKRNKKQNIMKSIYLFMPRRTYIIYYNIYLRKFKFKPLSSGEISMYISVKRDRAV